MGNLQCLLQGHPNHNLVQAVVQGFRHGFLLMHDELRVNHQPRNLPTAFRHSDLLWQGVKKEVNLCQMLGPFDVQSLDSLICSAVSMVKKKNSKAMCCITHLSHPQGLSITSFIAPGDAETHY